MFIQDLTFSASGPRSGGTYIDRPLDAASILFTVQYSAKKSSFPGESSDIEVCLLKLEPFGFQPEEELQTISYLGWRNLRRFSF